MSVNYQFGLRFINGEVHFLLSDRKVVDWTVLHRIDIESTNLTVEMVRFCNRVKQETNGDCAVAVFLSEPDIQVSEVSVAGHDKKQRETHVKRTIARRLSDTSENIEAECGPVDQYNIAPVFYALKDTLSTARQFVGRFGFDVAYFGAVGMPRGFTTSPRLQQPEKPKTTFRAYLGASVQTMYYATFSAIFCASALLVGTADNQSPISLATLQNDRPFYTATQFTGLTADRGYRHDLRNNTLVQSIYANEAGFDGVAASRAVSISEFTLPTLDFAAVQLDQYADRLQNPAPRNLSRMIASLTLPASPESPKINVTTGASYQLAALTQVAQTPRDVAAIQTASRVIPSDKSADMMDQIAAFQGGFFVVIGQQQNRTKPASIDQQYADIGQVKFIHEDVATTRLANTLPLRNLDTAAISWPDGQDIELISVLAQN